MSRPSGPRRRLLTAVTAFVCLAAPAAAFASPDHPASSHPSISSLTVSPTTVSDHGGTVQLKATVHHASSCKTSSSPSLPGLPTTKSCSSGSLNLSLHLGSNSGTSAKHFTITVKATKSGHSTTKTVHLTQSPTPPKPTLTGLMASPSQLTSSGGNVAVTATVKNASSCKLSVSPTVTGLPANVSCSSSSFSHTVALPANLGSVAQSYVFTLTATGTGGTVTSTTHPMATVAGVSAPTPVTTPNAVEADLPAGAYTGANSNADLQSVSCPAAGDCVAVGYYYATPTGSQTVAEDGLIETLDGTTWNAATAPTPTDIDTTESAVELDSVSCSSATACVAVGFYLADNSGQEPYVATLSGSTWTWQPASVPADGSSPTRVDGQLLSVSCASDGSCVAVGKSEPPGDDDDALIEQPGTGGWTGIQAPIPSNGDAEQDNDAQVEDILYDVSCTSATNCAAVGEYTVGAGETLSTQGMADSLTSSGWTSTELAPTTEEGYDKAVGCGGSVCVGTGVYDSSYPEIQTGSAGLWDPTQAVVAPQPTAIGGAGLNGVSCTSDSSCVLVGSAYSTGGSPTPYPLIDTGSGTTYSDLEAGLPSNAKSTTHGMLSTVSCAAAGSCVAVGSYDGSDEPSGYYDELLETETTANGTSTWTPSELPLPTGDSDPGTLYSTSCVTGWGCASVGFISPTGSNGTGQLVTTPL